MSPTDSVRLIPETLPLEPTPRPELAQGCDLLRRTFGVDFTMLDGESGELLEPAEDQPGVDWHARAEMCREVFRRHQPEFLDVEDPLITLAIPLEGPQGVSRVMAAVFLTRPLKPGEKLPAAAKALGIEPQEAAQWAEGRVPWAAEQLERVAQLALEQIDGWQRIEDLEQEATKLSDNLASTYEEISLLYRLTQNLKISKGDVDLGNIALEWLQEVIPAEGLALQLVPVAADAKSLTPEVRTEPTLLTYGECPIDSAQFTRLAEHLRLASATRPAVVNPPATAGPDWPCPDVRQLIAVQLAEGENLFGFLAAFNHRGGGEFGTIEASLLSSVAAILGIHSGNIELYRQQAETLAGIVRALTSAIDAKDPYTCGHSDRVARVAVRLAAELGCDAKALNTIYLSGLLHDIGKIGIDDSVLRKPGKLSDEEYEYIKRHVVIGHRILMDLKKLDDVLPVVLYHHESWDGSGYPHKLPEGKIPLPARIVAVADAFDAMGSDRPYRRGMPDEKIDEIFRAGAGKQWDPEVIDAFFRARDDVREIVREKEHEVQVQRPTTPPS
jgi:HD-GYP domain-containing protein (c-di-GMP phosphodiesterase class II)